MHFESVRAVKDIAGACAEDAMQSPQAHPLQGEGQGGTSDELDPLYVKNPFQRAAGMHRMAYHRARLRHILHHAMQHLPAGGLSHLLQIGTSCTFIAMLHLVLVSEAVPLGLLLGCFTMAILQWHK